MRLSYSIPAVAICISICISELAAAEGFGCLANIAQDSPVFRPVEVFSLVKNGTISSADRRTRLEVGRDSKLGRVVWWRVSASDETNGWSTTRLDIPERALGNAIGVRFVVKVPRKTDISVDFYTRVLGPNFYGAEILGSVRKILDPGYNNLVVRFSEATSSPEKVQGFGLSYAGAMKEDLAIAFSRIDLIFPTEEQARRFEFEPIKTSLEILKARGIDLLHFCDKLSYYQLDQLCWRGFHLTAIKEQIEYWSRLTTSLKKSQLKGNEVRLRQKRNLLVSQLRQGKAIDVELTKLQAQVDSWIDHCMHILPVEKRRWRVGPDGRFHYPDGRPFRMLGPYPFRLDFPSKDSRMVKPWDIRYLAALGFNGIRLAINWAILEPKRGKFARWYLEELKWIARKCERYGMGLSIDLHFARPEWFQTGQPGYECTTSTAQAYATAYHWPEALADTWEHLAKEFRVVPNVVAWEVPVNEPVVVTGSHGISAYPRLVRSWNSWLKSTYGTRANLKAAWNSGKHPELYGLRDDESWENNSIRWMILEDRPDIQANYRDNPRLWDHLRWTAFLQRTTTELIMRRIRKHWPGAVGMMHRTIGEHWDQCPVPIDYTSIETIRGRYVMPGTHYGIAGLSAQCAASQTQASYDTEQHVRGAQEAVRKHVELGLGLCPFWFSHGGYNHETILCDAYGHMQKDAAYLAKEAEWIRNYWPKKDGRAKVAVVLSTRLQATRQLRLGELMKMLEQMNFGVSVFHGIEVAQRPDLLKGHFAVITPANYMDVNLLRVLDENYSGVVLLHGSLERDAWARNPNTGLPKELVKRNLFLKTTSISDLSHDLVGKIDLSGEWDFFHTFATVDPQSGPPAESANLEWVKMPAPALWDGTGLLAFTATKNVLGDAWYRKKVRIPPEWNGKSINIQFGSIDDYDWVYVNGKMIGHTDWNTPDAYAAPRRYAIPDGIIKPGHENEIHVLVRNVAADGGISAGPIELVAETGWRLQGIENGSIIHVGHSATRVTRDQLLDNVDVAATLVSDKEECVALVRQDRWWWWVSDLPWNNRPEEIEVLRRVLGHQ
ncbi:MAG: cellulase family glycosylhydrolase [Armatimonadetes bacterium]|nr:cellulase family glycosylhydrolase [Armatimonadota bacterium]